jgi:hypothetical protein
MGNTKSGALRDDEAKSSFRDTRVSGNRRAAGNKRMSAFDPKRTLTPPNLC